MNSTNPSRIRRLSMRIAVAGALVAVPLAALAIPASADSTGISVASQVSDQDWNHDGNGDNRDRHDRHGNRGPEHPQPQPQPGLPSTGSFGF